MCEKQKRIEELERELHDIKLHEVEMFRNMREAYKFEAEQNNFDSMTRWRPWQIMAVGVLTPTVLSLAALVTALIK